jgi:hypothetical protein
MNYVVLQVESQFGIVVRDSDAEEIHTMGDLYNFVLTKVGQRPQHVCISSATFYRLRRALGNLFGVPRGNVRTTSRLEDLIPIQDRKKHWQRLCAVISGESLSSPRRPKWLTRSLAIAWIASFMTAVALGAVSYETGLPPSLWAAITGLAVGLSFLILWVGYRLTTAWEICIPPSCRTVRDIVYVLVGHGKACVVSNEHRPSGEEIWNVLCGIVGDEVDIQPKSLTKASHPWSP